MKTIRNSSSPATRRGFLTSTLSSAAATSLLLVFAPVAGGRDAAEPPKDDVYSRAAEGTYTVPPELNNFRLLSSTPLKLNNAKALGYDLRQWQSDPSRIIYHDGRYHAWMIDVDFPGEYNRTVRPADGLSWILYMNSKDGKSWNAVGYVPLGPKGSCYDLGIEQANVLMHEGRFYLFSEAYTTNLGKYKRREAGIVCLVADSPEGPWKQVGDLMLRPSMDGRSFDCDKVVNPRHVFLNGKWFMYYKGHKKGQPTDNGVAIADSLTGPYKKYEGNPLLHGHGHFAWRYKHGVIMLMFDADHEKNDSRLLWTEDGLHFVPLAESKGLFLFGSLYCPDDPLCGKPVTDEPPTRYWGLQSVYHRGTTGWDVERIEWQLGGETKTAARKRGRGSFAGTARRVLRTNEPRPLFRAPPRERLHLSVTTFSERELIILRKGASSFELHDLGSTKLAAQLGKAFAEAMADWINKESPVC